MKWILFLATPFLMGACNILHSSTEQSDKLSESIDSNKVYIFNDSIDKIIKHPSYIKMYKMVGLIRDSTVAAQKDSLFNYPIEKCLGKVTKQEKELLEFYIGDNRQYRKDYMPIRQPFNPDFALEFIRNKQKVYYFISFGTGEIAIANEKGNLHYYLMRDANVMERWFEYVLNKRNKK